MVLVWILFYTAELIKQLGDFLDKDKGASLKLALSEDDTLQVCIFMFAH